ncbi:tRNA (Guanosine(18)-2'-O)-methyltransferase [Balamuthia mandrillaris]
MKEKLSSLSSPFRHVCAPSSSSSSSTSWHFLFASLRPKHRIHQHTLRLGTHKSFCTASSHDALLSEQARMVRHKPLRRLSTGTVRPLVVACMPLKSNANVSSIARVASNCAVQHLVCCGQARLLGPIVRQARLQQQPEEEQKRKKGKKKGPRAEEEEAEEAEEAQAEAEAREEESNEKRAGVDNNWFIVKNGLKHTLLDYKRQGYKLIGLEQTNNSQDIHGFAFPRKMVLVVGNEASGISEEILAMMDAVVEIPVWGLPYSYNVATSTAMALYEYCRQHPS